VATFLIDKKGKVAYNLPQGSKASRCITKIELISPTQTTIKRKRRKDLCPPLGLAMVAALTPPDVEVSLIDESVMDIDFQKDIDLVGIAAATATASRAYQIADIFRARGVKVVLGGIHPTALPEEASEHADAVLIGEAEGVWPRLVQDFKANKLQKVYGQNKWPSLTGLPVPRRELFSKAAYWFPDTISTTRGCPYSCSFCTVTSFFGHTYRCRPIAEVLKEIEALKNNRIIGFIDDNIVGNPKYAKELFRALIPYKIKWGGQASVTIAKDEELLKLAAESGCFWLLIGFESLSAANLAAVNKTINVVDEYEQTITKIHKHGISIHGFFIFGFDDDDEGVFERTVRFAQKMHLESAQFEILTPYPGTALYESLDKAGRIISKDWSQYGYDVPFKPKVLSRDILLKGRLWAHHQFYSIPSIWNRIGIRHRDLKLLWVMNLSYRARKRKRGS
jgi:radical SAM superfamily enzyme YgiQ (UPF0313 family)